MNSSDNNGDRDEEDDDDDSGNNYYHRVFDYCFSELPKIRWGWLVVMMEYIDAYCTNASMLRGLGETNGCRMATQCSISTFDHGGDHRGSTVLGNGQHQWFKYTEKMIIW
ncbi:hypothetical protein RHGRI_000385 [Rhododendron griersonianum]|uniref:Uncharacterized protein n=1 Tax=Rhododendron griersonianum TaxID=479676 RepID=A0AAV6LGF5_9ERIC|nr:hypothetical protein RHGRI_000385 [Rhododendron griersonianum]